jgi:branched-chain amino acid transport system permease protein
MSSITQFLLFGVLISGLYALVAIGFTLIFGVGGILNLTHATFVIIGAYTVFALHEMGVPLAITLLFAVVLVPTLFSIGVYYAVRPIQDDEIKTLIVTLMLVLIAGEVILRFISSDPVSLPNFLPRSRAFVEIAGLRLQSIRVIGFVVSWLLIIGVWVFTRYTKVGTAVLALSMDKKGARMVGINEHRIHLLVWVLSGILASISGIFLTSFQGLNVNIGLDALIISFAIVIFGGIGSIKGSVIGAYTLGLIETGTTFFVDPALRGVPSLLLIIVVLLIRPEGLYGREMVE